MSFPRFLSSLRNMDWNPTHWLRTGLLVLGRALTRLWGRDVMLYSGGVSFFVMLAIFPALAILIGLYSLLADPVQAAREGQALSTIMPSGVREIFQKELLRLVQTPHVAVSTQSGLALIVAAYASHRGFKALLAGLSFIHDEDEPHGFVGFNLLATRLRSHASSASSRRLPGQSVKFIECISSFGSRSQVSRIWVSPNPSYGWFARHATRPNSRQVPKGAEYGSARTSRDLRQRSPSSARQPKG